MKAKTPLNINRLYYAGMYEVHLCDYLPRCDKYTALVKFSPRASGVLYLLDWRLLTLTPSALTLRQAAALFGVETLRKQVIRRAAAAQLRMELAA